MNSDLDPDFVVLAYSSGYFPMAESRTGPISWYSPDPRAIIPLDTFKVSRSLRQTIRKQLFQTTINAASESVIRLCAERDETWISDEIINAYLHLHRQSIVHTVETWHQGNLVGGLYGVAIGGAFFGESMFSRMTGASKVALVHLVERLIARKFTLLDTQFINDHVLQFGAHEIPRLEYMQILRKALTIKTSFVDLHPP